MTTNEAKQEEPTDEEISLEYLRKYVNLNISKAKDSRLRAMYKKERDQETFNEFKDKECFIKMQKIILNADKNRLLSKKDLARIIYQAVLVSPRLNIGTLCMNAGISTSHYRELKAANKDQWKETETDMQESNYIFTVVMANDSNVSDKYWIEWFGENDDRNRWKV